MSFRSRTNRLRIDAQLVLLAVIVLGLCVSYNLVFIVQGPYPGLDYDSQWNVIAIDSNCGGQTSWCESNQSQILPGDHLLKVGNLSYADYKRDRSLVPFAGYQQGSPVRLTVERRGTAAVVDWIYIGPDLHTIGFRILALLFFLPFWIAGTGVLLLLRPRDRRWLLLVLFNYLTGFWIAVGNFSILRVGAAAVVLGTTTLLLIPVYLHLHLLVPSPIKLRGSRVLLTLLYGVSVLVALANIVVPLPNTIFSLGMLCTIAGCLGLLVYRLRRSTSLSVRLASRLLLIGVCLSFGPAILLWLIPILIGLKAPNGFLLAVSSAAIPLLPFFYIYTVYKQHLGGLEFRANRVLSIYSFLLLISTGLVLIFLLGSSWAGLNIRGLVFTLTVSIVFVVLVLWLQAPFLRLVDRVAYGTKHNPDTIIRTFANQIPRALDRDALARLLVQDVSPALLVRQSALYLLAGTEITPVYADGVPPYAGRDLLSELQRLLRHDSAYAPPDTGSSSELPFAWVRLTIPIEVGGKRTAVWLLGKRDPDDFYPQPDIELLTTLANQVGVALETPRLFQDLERRAGELETAYRDLQRLDQLKDEFVQNVSHELRTPLTFLRGYVDMLLEEMLGPLTPQQHEALTTMSDRTEGIIRLVNDIISLQNNRVDELLHEPVNVVALAGSCVEAMQVSLRRREDKRRTPTVRLIANQDVPTITGDRRRLAQVIDNLISNAVKFSPAGGEITVEVGARQEQFGSPDEAPRRAVVITVSDHGIGIPSTQLELVWQRFYQVDGSSTRRFGGMGLGLSIARGIIEAHGGRIWAESQEGQGACFHILLPQDETET